GGAGVASSAGAGGASPGTTVKTATINGATVLTNAKGFTVYSFAPDTPTTSRCNGQCAKYWPPVKGPLTAQPPSPPPPPPLPAPTAGHPHYPHPPATAPGQAKAPAPPPPAGSGTRSPHPGRPPRPRLPAAAPHPGEAATGTDRAGMAIFLHQPCRRDQLVGDSFLRPASRSPVPSCLPAPDSPHRQTCWSHITGPRPDNAVCPDRVRRGAG